MGDDKLLATRVRDSARRSDRAKVAERHTRADLDLLVGSLAAYGR